MTGNIRGRRWVEMTDKNDKAKNNYTTNKLMSFMLIIVLLIISFCLYLFYKNPDYGIALINPELHNMDILLLGIDDHDRERTNMDSIILVQVRARERNLVFEEISPDIKMGRNTSGAMDVDRVISEIGNITGNKPDYYFIINYQGFKKIIDEISGIEIALQASVEVPELGLYLKEGNNLLSGREALNYARWYNDNVDSSNRVNGQKKIIKGIADKVFQANTLLNIPGLYSTIVETYRGVDTNLDKELAVQIIKLIRNSDMWNIEYRVR